MGIERVFVEGPASAPRIACDHLGAGALVLFLHGIGGNRTNWTRQLHSVGEHFHAVAWDARGYGDSDDYDGPLDFGDFSDDLLRVLAHFGAATAHLVGLSLGGRIALDFYERHPDRVASLVLCDTFPGFEASFSPEARDEFIRSRREPLLRGVSPREMAPEVAKTLVSPSTTPAIVEQLIESMANLHVESYIKTIEATTRYEPVADLAKVEVPTQIIVGEDDRLTPPVISRRMAAALPEARLAVVEQAGHLTNLEQPERFDALVLEFLRGAGVAS